MLIRMKSWLLFAALAAVLTLAGCRQPDGTMPTPQGDDPGRITDIVNNLDNISRGDQEGPRDLASDLAIFIQGKPQADGPVNELAKRTAMAFTGRSLADEPTQQFARQLWMTVRAWQLSERQVEALQTDITTTLTAGGVPTEQIAPITAQVAEVQRAVNETPRRWYQWF